MPSVAGGSGTSVSGGDFLLDDLVGRRADPRDEVLLERLAFFFLAGFRFVVAGVLAAGFLAGRFLAIARPPP